MTKIKALIRKFWEMEGIRFLFVSGVNTVVGLLLTLFFGEVLKLPDPLPVVFNYICCSPFAYFMQARIAFRTKMVLPRYFAYLGSSVPNVLLLSALTSLFEYQIKLPHIIGYALSYVIAIPLLFIMVNLIVQPGSERRAKSLAKKKKDDK